MHSGELAFVFKDDVPTLALTVATVEGSQGLLLLEGPNAGQLENLLHFSHIVLTDPVVVTLPSRGRSSISTKPPKDKALFVAIDGEETFFVFPVNGGEFGMANIATGELSDFDQSGFYLTQWELWLEDEAAREPLLTTE